MALGTFVAGAYTATWDADAGGAGAAAALGMTRQGFEIGITYATQPINQTDRFGQTTIDDIYQGVSEVTITAEQLEWEADLLAMLTPWATSPLLNTGATYFDIGIIGRLGSNEAGTFVLTSTTGTPAVSSPATMTATYCIPRPGQNIGWALSQNLRTIPYTLRVYPYLDTQYKFFSAT